MARINLNVQINDLLVNYPSNTGHVLQEDHDGYYVENGESYPENFIYHLFIYDQERVYIYYADDYIGQPATNFSLSSIKTPQECNRFYKLGDFRQ
jgi:hypothetical protein